MSISPMSGASAPAQCKGKDEKALEQAKKKSTAEMNDPARKAREEQTLNAYGQKLRADVTQKSSGVTASTPAKSLLTGNRLNYMRSDEKDPEKDAARAVRNQAMRVPSLEMVQHMNQSVQDPANRSQSIKSLANGAKDLPDTPEIRAARSKAVDNIRLWLGMLRNDPRTMEHYQMQRDKVYAPMGDFDANTNKGGIVGGSRHAGLYALNDMFLRGTAKELYDDSRKHRDSEGNTNAIGHAIIDRTSDMMAMMNAVFAKTGNLQDMDEQERTVYDMMMAMDAPAAPAAPAVDPYGGQTHGARPTASSGSDWSRMTPQDWMAVAPSQTYDGPDPGKKKKWYQFWK